MPLYNIIDAFFYWITPYMTIKHTKKSFQSFLKNNLSRMKSKINYWAMLTSVPGALVKNAKREDFK